MVVGVHHDGEDACQVVGPLFVLGPLQVVWDGQHRDVDGGLDGVFARAIGQFFVDALFVLVEPRVVFAVFADNFEQIFEAFLAGVGHGNEWFLADIYNIITNTSPLCLKFRLY